jgi:hypothetical protein
MKLVKVESSIGLDRLATWNEVCCAMSLSLQGALELGAPRACNRPEDFTRWAIVSEMPSSISN